MSVLRKCSAAAVLAVGAVLGGLGTAALIHFPAKAEAQADAKPSAPGRFQVSAFGYGYGYTGPNSTSSVAKWGAYVVDTQTGELFVSIESGKPHSVGHVGEK